MAEPEDKIDTTEFAPETPVIVEEVPLVIPANRPRKVYDGMWGPLEIGAVAAGVLAVMTGLVLFFLWVMPSNRELAKNKAEADRLDEIGRASCRERV